MRNVRFGLPSAACLQPVKSFTGCVVDQLNQACDISQDLLSNKFDFVGGKLYRIIKYPVCIGRLQSPSGHNQKVGSLTECNFAAGSGVGYHFFD